jgi:hypothetical protein
MVVMVLFVSLASIDRISFDNLSMKKRVVLSGVLVENGYCGLSDVFSSNQLKRGEGNQDFWERREYFFNLESYDRIGHQQSVSTFFLFGLYTEFLVCEYESNGYVIRDAPLVEGWCSVASRDDRNLL